MQSENGEDGEGEEEGNEGDDEATKEEHSFIPTFSLYIITNWKDCLMVGTKRSHKEHKFSFLEKLHIGSWDIFIFFNCRLSNYSLMFPFQRFFLSQTNIYFGIQPFLKG